MSKNFEEYRQSNSKIVFIDGDCHLCHKAALFIIKYDQSKGILIAKLQSRLGMEACRATGQDDKDLDTFVFLDDGQVFTESSAIIELCQYFPLVFRWVARLAKLLPRFLRDFIYRKIAQKRHTIAPKADCPSPPEKYRERFLH